MSNHSRLAEETAGLSIVRTAFVAVLTVVGIAWIAVYETMADPKKLTWMYDLEKWNFLIGFGLIMVALMLASDKGTPLGRGRGVVIGMLGCFLIGLIWIVLYYFTVDSDFPLISDLGQ